MNFRKIIIPALFLILLPYSSAISKSKSKPDTPLTEDVDILFKAKGLKSMENITKLKPKQKDQELKPEEICQLSLDLAFSNFINPELSSVVKKKGGEDLECYIFAFKEDGLSQLSFCYQKGDANPFLWKSAGLAKDWQISVPSGSGMIVLGSKTCSYIFEVKNPLKAIAVPLK